MSPDLIREAYLEAEKGFNEGGLPIGSVLADEAGKIEDNSDSFDRACRRSQIAQSENA